jgi:hypothetical protein
VTAFKSSVSIHENQVQFCPRSELPTSFTENNQTITKQVIRYTGITICLQKKRLNFTYAVVAIVPFRSAVSADCITLHYITLSQLDRLLLARSKVQRSIVHSLSASDE